MITFFLDTNKINGRKLLPHMNKLEVLASDGKCELLMPKIAWNEAAAGNNETREEKTWSYYFIGLKYTNSQKYWFSEVEKIVFPSGADTQNKKNDVWVLVTAREMNYPLITNDGDSKFQPGGMLGNRKELSKIGICIIRDEEAIEMVLNYVNS